LYADFNKAIQAEYNKVFEAKLKAKTEEQKRREEFLAAAKMDKQLRSADRQLQETEFEVNISLGNVKVAVSDGAQGNRTHAEVGVCGQSIHASKVGKRIHANFFGATMDIYSEFT